MGREGAGEGGGGLNKAHDPTSCSDLHEKANTKSPAQVHNIRHTHTHIYIYEGLWENISNGL